MNVTEGIIKKLNTQKPVDFYTEHRAYFSELDPFNHVNTEVYSSYYLKHRFSELRDNLGLDMKAISKLDVAFVVTNLSINFLNPILADHEFIITSKIVNVTLTKCTIECKIVRGQDIILSECSMTLACISKENLRSCKWPVDFISKFYE